MRRAIGLFLSTLLTLSTFLFIDASKADETSVGDPGKAWSIPNDAERGLHIQQHIDSSPGDSTSFLIDPALRSDIKVDPTCKSVRDERCISSQLQYSSLLPVCGPLSDVYCIEEFGVTDEDGNVTAEAYVTPNYANIDTIGIIYKPTGEMLQGEDGPYPAMAPIEGWHVNVRLVGEDADALAPFVVEPKTPVRVWG